MKRKIFTATVFVCCFMICFAAVLDLNGKWKGIISTDDGSEIPVTYSFKVDGDKLTGTADSPQGVAPIDDGKINGSDFSFSVTVQGVSYPHTGKLYQDSCAMNIDINSQKIHFVVKRTNK